MNPMSRLNRTDPTDVDGFTTVDTAPGAARSHHPDDRVSACAAGPRSGPKDGRSTDPISAPRGPVALGPEDGRPKPDLS
jgi:hypothetical protein